MITTKRLRGQALPPILYLFPYHVEEWEKEEQDRDDHDRTRYRSRKENVERAARHDHRLPERPLRQWTEHEGEDSRRHGIVHLAHQIGTGTQSQHQPKVMQALGHGVGPDHAQNIDDRGEDGKGKLQHPEEDGDRRQVEHQRKNVGDVKAGDQAPDEVLVGDEHHRPGLETPDHHPAQQQGGGRRAGNTKGQHGQHGAGTGGVVGRLRRRDAADVAFSISVPILRQALCDAVGHQRARGCAGSRKHADKEPHNRAYTYGLVRTSRLP